MAAPFEKLAQSLGELRKLQNEKGIAVIRASDLSRTHKERLVANGFLQEVIKGWYISSSPDEQEGNTTAWYISFWYFASVYFNSRFGKDWCLSPEQSLSLHSGNTTVPKQLLIRSPKAQNNLIRLLHDTTFFDLKLALPSENERSEKDGVRVYSVAAGLLACSPDYFADNSTDARTCLEIVKDPSDILSLLLEGGHSVKAGRIAGAFRNIGKDRYADDIIATMKSAGYDVREEDPFKEKLKFVFGSREVFSPYATRIRLMWHKMRPTIIDSFPIAPGLPIDKISFLQNVDNQYVADAYHSLSIEGYQVTAELIDKVRSGLWDPEGDETDKNQKNALAARGYWQAFQAVENSVSDILDGNNPGEVVDVGHGIWYRELFTPSVVAGILKASDLAGYRTNQVYIKGSKHAPPNKEAVRDMMPVLFDLLKEETEPCVRAVLGHFVFVYIHPYMDGNGRISRFLMNAMLASGGYPWTIIPVEQRNEYLTALERASVDQDISEFTNFLARLVKKL